ncbi:MAG: efflux RND transporter periplasmic adaptor subunit [Bacteroidales bacterium]|nr:efflux RND transporter periplasmic adaptor subunit [Candidatus Colimorpha onthohippi]
MNKVVKFAYMALALITINSINGCGGKGEATSADSASITKETENVKVLTLQSERIAKRLEVSSTLEGYEKMDIAPSITGHIDHIFVEVGSRVAKGAMLVRMDQTQLNTTRITLNSTKVELDRIIALRQSGNVSEQVYDQTKASYEQLVETEKFQDANTFVKAQFSGVISAKNFEDGEMYTGQPILTLTQINKLKAIISIPESYYPLVHTGMKVAIASDIYPESEFSGSIEIVYPTIDASTHTFQVKISIPNGNEKLRPGMYVRTTLALGEMNAILVPYQSVLKLTGSNDRYVFVNNEGKARRVSVTLGQRFDDKIEIIPVQSGDIKEGDQLIVAGQARLVDGSALNIMQ